MGKRSTDCQPQLAHAANCSRCRPSDRLLIGEENKKIIFFFFAVIIITSGGLYHLKMWRGGVWGSEGRKKTKMMVTWCHFKKLCASVLPRNGMQACHFSLYNTKSKPHSTPWTFKMWKRNLYTKYSLTPSLCMRLGSCQLDEAHTTARVQKVMGRTSSQRPSTHTHQTLHKPKHCTHAKAQSDAKIVKAIHIAQFHSMTVIWHIKSSIRCEKVSIWCMKVNLTQGIFKIKLLKPTQTILKQHKIYSQTVQKLLSFD